MNILGLTFETGLEDMLDMVKEAGCKVDRKKGKDLLPEEIG